MDVLGIIGRVAEEIECVKKGFFKVEAG